jgi:osmotically inducible protein OsmC
LDRIAFTFDSRFNERIGTNPEELLASAQASCFIMKLSFILGEAGFPPGKLTTKATITFENGNIARSHLIVTADIPGLNISILEDCVRDTERTCPVSSVLNIPTTTESILE